jgi:hypothetical protein
MSNFVTTIGVTGVVFLTMITTSFAQSIERVRFGVHPNMTRVVLDTNGDSSSIAYHVSPPNKSNTLLIAFPKEVSWNAPNSFSTLIGAVNGYQFKAHSKSGALEITTNIPVKIKRSFTLPRSGKNNARIIFDLIKDLAPKENIKLPPQELRTLQPQSLRPTASLTEPVPLAQPMQMPREPWLKNWLSKAIPRENSQVFQPTDTLPLAERIQRKDTTFGLPTYLLSPAPIATPLEMAEFNNHRMPVVSDSLGPKYQLPQSAQLDPLQKQAQTKEVTKGTYIGTGFGISFIDQNISSDSDAAKISGSPKYFKIFAGHRFNRFYSAELFYSDLGKSSSTSNGLQRSEIELSAAGAAFQLGYPILEQLVPFMKVGVVALNQDATISGEGFGKWLPRSYLGLGIDCWLTPNIGIRSEYENYALNNSSVSAALVYKF